MNFAGFSFNPAMAAEQCREWLEGCPDIEPEYIETQRASIANMLRLKTDMTEKQREELLVVENLLRDHIVSLGLPIADFPADDALGGDLLDLGFDNNRLG